MLTRTLFSSLSHLMLSINPDTSPSTTTQLSNPRISTSPRTTIRPSNLRISTIPGTSTGPRNTRLNSRAIPLLLL